MAAEAPYERLARCAYNGGYDVHAVYGGTEPAKTSIPEHVLEEDDSTTSYGGSQYTASYAKPGKVSRPTVAHGSSDPVISTTGYNQGNTYGSGGAEDDSRRPASYGTKPTYKRDDEENDYGGEKTEYQEGRTGYGGGRAEYGRSRPSQKTHGYGGDNDERKPSWREGQIGYTEDNPHGRRVDQHSEYEGNRTSERSTYGRRDEDHRLASDTGSLSLESDSDHRGRGERESKKFNVESDDSDNEDNHHKKRERRNRKHGDY